MCFFGQPFKFGNAPDVLLPAGKGLIDRFGSAQLGEYGKIPGHTPVYVIAYADLDLVQVSQTVDGGKGYLGGSLDHTTVSAGYRVVPAHPAGTACGGAELSLIAAPAAQFVPVGSRQFTDKGLTGSAYAGGVCLGDADHVPDGGGGNASSHGAKTGQGVGGSDEGVDPVVGVLHGAQLSLQKDGLSLFKSLMDKGYRISHIGGNGLPLGHESVKKGLGIQRFLVVKVGPENVF